MDNEEVIVSLENGFRLIKLNSPKKMNAMDQGTYKKLRDILREDANNEDVVVTVLTGVGEYFSSGNDISSLITSDFEEAVKEATDVVKDTIEAFINYPKVLIAVVNGPAIGIGCTLLLLCDIIYASDKATFETPFIRLGLCLEGASSFLLPFSLGRSKASEMLFLNHILTAKEAYNFRLLADVIPHHELDGFIRKLSKFGSLPLGSVVRNKKLMTHNFKNILSECNRRETEELLTCVESEEFFNAIINFVERKSKL